MAIRFYVYDKNGTLINEPEKSEKHVKGASFSTMWPKGFGIFTATVDRDIFPPWQVKTAYRLVVRDGQKTIFDGRLNAPVLARGDSRSQARLTAQGWYIILTERTIRKRWVDQNAISRLVWGAGRDSHEDQTSPIVEKRERDQFLRVSIRPKDMTIGTTNYYEERYVTPTGDIHKVDYDYAYRTGEGFDLLLVGGSTSLEDTENIISATHSSGSVSHTFTQGATSDFFFRIAPYTSTLYDQNDWASIKNMVVYMEYDASHSVSTPTYSIDEIVEDVVVIARGSEISADVSQISGSSTVLDNFVTRDDGYQRASEIIEELADFSDASQNTYGLMVWDGDSSSDGLPQVVYESRSVADYEYVVSGRDQNVVDYQVEYTVDDLYNWVTVKWTDPDGRVDYLSPDDDADLKDTTSITDYGERHADTLDAGETTQADAKQLAQRFLAYHKDPLYKGSIMLRGFIYNRGGVRVPVSHVRAGERVKLTDESGDVVFIRETSYDVDSDTLTITPDVPSDDIIYM